LTHIDQRFAHNDNPRMVNCVEVEGFQFRLGKAWAIAIVLSKGEDSFSDPSVFAIGGW
jgi:hypothetical protein